MKITAILLLTTCLQISARSYSQTITLAGKNMAMEKLFEEIHRQSGYEFLYNSRMLQQAANVDIDVQDVPLTQVLDLCFSNQPLTYEIVNKTIVVRLRETPVFDLPLPPGEIKGRVTNDKGEPLVNANVIIQRTKTGVVTDANGQFTLRNVRSSDELIVSFIGYKTQNIKVGGRSNFTLVMAPATNDLDKVVVQAYGTTSQRLATGNIGTVSAEQIARQPVMNPLEALQGQVPGVVVTNASGYASATVKVEIRGRSTISPNFPSDPLYIIDGVPLTILDLQNTDSYANGASGVIQSGIPSPANGQSPFFSINPLDIESIEVLKDADATAIYGSRGANGVILVTTKKGKAGKTKLDVNVYTGISQDIKFYKFLNTQQYVAMRKEALANDGLPVDIFNAPDLVVWDTTRYTDWQKYLWGGLGRQTDVQTSLSGGDARTTFRVAAGYRRQTDILTANGANKRGSLSFNLNHKSLNQRFNMSLTGDYSVASSDMIYAPGNILTLPPDAPAVLNKTGTSNYSGWQPLDDNYLFGITMQPYSATTKFLNSGLVLSYEMAKGLVFRTNLGYGNVQADQSFLTPIASQNPKYNPKGYSSFGNSFVTNLIAEPQLEYNGFIGKGKLTILAGASSQQNTTSSIYLGGNGYNNDALLASVSNAPVRQAGNALGKYSYAAAFGRISYNWENKYILNLNARRDGSSKFGPGRQFGNFGSIGGAWIFTEENWLKNNLPFLSFGKLRGSYGTTGNDQILNYAFLSLWSFTPTTYNNVLPLVPLGHTDSTLHWEVNKKTELAIDLGFLKDRISLSAVWYSNLCNNQLVPFPTPSLTGFLTVTSNSPADVENMGWEFTLNAHVLDNSNVKWSTRFNIGLNRNKLLAYPNFSQSPFAGTLTIGKSLNIKKVLHYTGVDPQTGLYTFQDRNKDGQITVDQSGRTIDDRYAVDMSPKFDGGFTNDLIYKNWQLSFFFYFRKQKGLNAIASIGPAGDMNNPPVQVLGRWQKPGDHAVSAKFTTMPYDISYQYYQSFSDAVYTDASFIRLRNLSLSYSLPERFLKKMGIGSCRFYVQGDNFFTITHYIGLDPEVQSFGGIPTARVITTGLSCNF